MVAHSPTPSMVSTAASSNGDGKNALAAWLWWCSVNRSLASTSLPAPHSCRCSRSSRFWNSFSLSHTGSAMRNEVKPLGANAR